MSCAVQGTRTTKRQSTSNGVRLRESLVGSWEGIWRDEDEDNDGKGEEGR
jgi:hypothetical protein